MLKCISSADSLIQVDLNRSDSDASNNSKPWKDFLLIVPFHPSTAYKFDYFVSSATYKRTERGWQIYLLHHWREAEEGGRRLNEQIHSTLLFSVFLRSFYFGS